MILQTGTSTTGLANVNEDFALRVFDTAGPNPFFVTAITGTITAAQNGDVYAMRLDPAAANPAHIRKVICTYRTVAAFTTPATFRAMRMRRFAGTVATGGTNIPVAGLRNGVGGATSEMNLAGGGDIRISVTSVLASPGTPDTLEVADQIVLTDYGGAGNNLRWVWDFEKSPLILAAGQSMAIGTSAAFDAGGTWVLGLEVDWFEGAVNT
jgi:hypothetical protein